MPEAIRRYKVMVVFGTRPEATKMGMVVRAMKRCNYFQTIVVVTGQHRQQLSQALAAFDIKPDLDLQIMRERQSLSYVLSSAIIGLEQAISDIRPDLVLVHGDTQSTVSATLAACYRKVPVAHVEAGLRSFQKYNPWPEEINRVLVDSVSDVLLAPTPESRDNLLSMGIERKRVFVTGQTQIDSALHMYREDYCFKSTMLREVDFGQRVIVVTAHRRENYGDPMNRIFRAIRRVADTFPDITVIYPVHLSPAVREQAYAVLSGHPRIRLLEPLTYPDMINLIARSYLVMSDSGGLQEECPVFHKPLVLMRETTERPEGVRAGITVLAGTHEETIYEVTSSLLTDPARYAQVASARNPFGDGKASERIVKVLGYYFGLEDRPPEEFSPDLAHD